MSPLIAACNRAQNYLDSLKRRAEVRLPSTSASDQRLSSQLAAIDLNKSIDEITEIIRLLDQAKTLANFHDALKTE